MRRDAWTPEEDALLRRGLPVPGRTRKACGVRAARLGCGYAPKYPKCARKISAELRERIAERLAETGKVRATARELGVSYSTVSTIGARRGIRRDRPSTERLGEFVEYGGRRFAWYDNCWRETSGRRESLARILYEKYNGSPPPKGSVVVFRNGDRLDLTKGNLVALSRSDGAKRNWTIPEYRAIQYANAVSSVLNIRILEAENPELVRKRVEKAWETKRRNGIVREKGTRNEADDRPAASRT